MMSIALSASVSALMLHRSTDSCLQTFSHVIYLHAFMGHNKSLAAAECVCQAVYCMAGMSLPSGLGIVS